MNKIIYLSLFFLVSHSIYSQEKQKIDSSYHNWYYQQRMDLYENLTSKKYDIVFLGNSITERGEWRELIANKMVANRGIGGDNTFGVLARLDNVIALTPKKIFILIGINDLGRGLPVQVIANNYRKIIERLKHALPKTKIYVESVLPLNEDVLKYDYLKGKRDQINELNGAIKKLAEEEYLTYINLHEIFTDDEGKLRQEWTIDGIHLEPVAYLHWVNFLKEKEYL